MKTYFTASLIALASFGLVSTTFAQSLTVTNQFRFEKNLTLGSVGDDVKQLQQLLNTNISTQVAPIPRAGSKGYETSVFGPGTALAVKAFQKAHGISATGFVGPLTRVALNDALAAAHPGMPSIIKVIADANGSSTTLTAQYDGGGEKPTLWFAYGATPSSMSILSKEIVSDKISGLTQITINNTTPGECFAVVYIKNSFGTAKSDWIRCAKY